MGERRIDGSERECVHAIGGIQRKCRAPRPEALPARPPQRGAQARRRARHAWGQIVGRAGEAQDGDLGLLTARQVDDRRGRRGQVGEQAVEIRERLTRAGDPGGEAGPSPGLRAVKAAAKRRATSVSVSVSAIVMTVTVGPEAR